MQPPPQDAPAAPGDGGAEEFNQGVANLLMGIEELRRSHPSGQQTSLALPDLYHWASQLQDGLAPALEQLGRWIMDLGSVLLGNEHQVHADLFRHVQGKLQQTAFQTLQAMSLVNEASLVDATLATAAGHTPHLGDDDDEEQRINAVQQDYQGVVAQTTELVLRLLLQEPPNLPPIPTHDESTLTPDEVIQFYVQFQRQTLRARAKPIVAKLIQERQQKRLSQSHTRRSLYKDDSKNNNNMGGQVVYHEDDDDQPSATTQSPPILAYEKHHANALAALLGHTAALMNPLLAWQVHLPPPIREPTSSSSSLDDNDTTPNVGQKTAVPPVDPVGTALARLCRDSLHILDEQAQPLTQTVCDWLQEDRPIQACLEHSSNDTRTDNDASPDLGFLDGLVDELALVCLLLAQYQTLTESFASSRTKSSGSDEDDAGQTKKKEALPGSSSTRLCEETTWTYARLETWLAVRQWQTALDLAQPVQIVLGSEIYVPSVVEDAQYLARRALERAAFSWQALAVVAHALANDVWWCERDDSSSDIGDNSNTEDHTKRGVHQALKEERGCWMELADDASAKKKKQEERRKKELEKKSSNTFASALLDALDDDLGGAPAPRPEPSKAKSSSSSKTPPRSQPSSGHFLAALTTTLSGAGGTGPEAMRLMQLQAKFCALNGWGAAAGACRSLAESLDGILAEPPTTATTDKDIEKATSMIQLARDELMRYASAYEQTQHEKLDHLIQNYATISQPNDPTPAWQHHHHHHHGLYLDHIGGFLAHENFHIKDAVSLQRLEADDRLESELMAPLRAYVFLQQVPRRSEFGVLLQLAERLSSRVVEVILQALWMELPDKERNCRSITDWGALLLVKEVRLIQTHLQHCLTPQLGGSGSSSNHHDPAQGEDASPSHTANNDGDDEEVKEQAGQVAALVSSQWERLTQALAILQMEQPSEWLLYKHTCTTLTPDEVAQTMKLRVDFSWEAIAAVTTTTTSE